MSPREITKCICHDHSFKEIKEYAKEDNLTTVEELREHDFCSNSCRMCTPYVENMLETGQTSFKYGEPFRK